MAPPRRRPRRRAWPDHGAPDHPLDPAVQTLPGDSFEAFPQETDPEQYQGDAPGDIEKDHGAFNRALRERQRASRSAIDASAPAVFGWYSLTGRSR